MDIRRRQLEVRESDINGDASPLLFGEPIGVDAGERFHERGLSVVDVPGGADDDRLHGKQSTSRAKNKPGSLVGGAGSNLHCMYQDRYCVTKGEMPVSCSGFLPGPPPPRAGLLISAS